MADRPTIRRVYKLEYREDDPFLSAVWLFKGKRMPTLTKGNKLFKVLELFFSSYKTDTLPRLSLKKGEREGWI